MKAWIALYRVFTSVQSAHLIENKQKGKKKRGHGLTHLNTGFAYSSTLGDAK